MVSVKAHGSGEHQLCHGGTVTAAVIFLQNIDQIGIRRSLHREILAEALIPGKRFFHRLCIFPNALLIINMERRRNFPRDFLQLFLCCKWCFHFLSFLLSCCIRSGSLFLPGQPEGKRSILHEHGYTDDPDSIRNFRCTWSRNGIPGSGRPARFFRRPHTGEPRFSFRRR